MHKLSLIIPCYNEEKTLRQIVERCLSLQSDSLSLELVIVNDCSKDGSDAVARSLVEKYGETVKYFPTKRTWARGGRHSARAFSNTK